MNRKKTKRPDGFRKRMTRAGILLGGAAMLLFAAGKESQAAPAVLESGSAVIYDRPDEGGTPVGNLVQGAGFELEETVTGEDGSVWRGVALANGMQGYLKGDVQIRAGTEAEPDGEAEDGPAEEMEAERNDAGEAGEEPLKEPESAEEAEGEIPGESPGFYDRQDDLPIRGFAGAAEKTYNRETDRVRIRADGGEQKKERQKETENARPRRGMDKALWATILALVIFTPAVCIAYQNLRSSEWKHKKQTESKLTKGLKPGKAQKAGLKTKKKKRRQSFFG